MSVEIGYIILWHLSWAILGAFGTAWVHEFTGRDVGVGGWLGLAIGGIIGPPGLITLWVSLVAQPNWLRGKLKNAERRWYKWWT